MRYPVEVGLIGDSQRSLRALLTHLNRKNDRAFLEKVQDGMRDWWQLMDEQATRTDKPMKPQVVARELGMRLRDDAILTSDSGTIATWVVRHVKIRRGQRDSTYTLPVMLIVQHQWHSVHTKYGPLAIFASSSRRCHPRSPAIRRSNSPNRWCAVNLTARRLH